MAQDWILDVLMDLRDFASANGLPATAEQLDDTRMMALAEIASQSERAPSGDEGRAGAHTGTAGDGDCA
jgi:hypothetical protein